MRTKPYFKKSHRAWYVNLDGRPKRLGTDEQAARHAYVRLVAQLQGDWTVAELVEKFLAHHAKTSDGSTCRYYRQVEAFSASLGAMRVWDLKPFHVTAWIADRSPRIIRAIKACFVWAEKQEYIKQSPLRNLKAPQATSRGDDAYLTPDQLAAFLRIVPSGLYDLVRVMRETGCRPQEIRRVESRHFDRAGRCWVFPIHESKGKRSSRIVHLSAAAFEICQRLALKYPEGRLFRNSKGRPWTTSNLVSRFERLSKRLGFRVTAYSLRHCWITNAIINGVDLATIATLAGHTSIKMVCMVYQHLNCRSDHLKTALKQAIA